VCSALSEICSALTWESWCANHGRVLRTSRRRSNRFRISTTLSLLVKRPSLITLRVKMGFEMCKTQQCEIYTSRILSVYRAAIAEGSKTVACERRFQSVQQVSAL
jgi:hypothetical protein